MTSLGASQQVQGIAIPVLDVQPPPEGFVVVPLTCNLTNELFEQTFSQPLGTGISQVVTIFVDNSQNADTLTIIHGAALTQTIVPAGGGAIMPTETARGAQAYNFTLELPSAPQPGQTVPIGIKLYNYEIQPDIWGNTVIQETNTIDEGALPNIFANAACEIFQRGGPRTNAGVTVAANTTVYTFDRWLVGNSGSQVVNVTFGGNLGALGESLQMSVPGAGNTDTMVIRREPNNNVFPAIGNQVCLQFKVRNQGVNPITPQVSIFAPTSSNNFSALGPSLLSMAAQQCAVGQTTQCAICFVMPAVGTGMQLEIDFGALPAGVIIAIGDIDMSIDEIDSPGLVASPPPPRATPIELDNARCYSYYWDSSTGGITEALFFRNVSAAAGAARIGAQMFPVPMIQIPTITFKNITLTNCTTLTANAVNTSVFAFHPVVDFTSTAVAIASFDAIANAEL